MPTERRSPMPTKQLVPKIRALANLRRRAMSDDRYVTLALTAARNLGGAPRDFADALRWLETTAAETDERGVVGEINFVRDCV